MHTSPLLQPGMGDAGGMNVYVDELAKTMAGRGVGVEVFTRRHDPGLADTVDVAPGYRVRHIDAGPAEAISVRKLPTFVREFAEGVVAACRDDGRPDVVHSHYWLSGWAGLVIKRHLGVPLANSFHTLGRVKDLTRRDGEPPESLIRIAAELEVIEGSDCLVASTPFEAEDLLTHYGADPGRLCMSPPGVDHRIFCPGDRRAARARLGFDDSPLVLFVGRIQSLKAVDIAIETFALVKARVPDAKMLVIGGPSGPKGRRETESLHRLVTRLHLEGAVTFLDPVPHRRLTDYYQAANVLHVPSRSESFGLVAVEAQACGLPVVAARAGGLVHVVDHDRSGILVEGWHPHDHAEAVARVLTDHLLAERFAAQAVEWAERFNWEVTANRFLELYAGSVGHLGRG